MKRIMLAVMLATAAVVWCKRPAPAFELGALQAVPGRHPPYVFRIPMIRQDLDAPVPPAVTVRSPADRLAALGTL